MTNLVTDKIECDCCGGSGKTPLRDEYQQTLNSLRNLKTPRTAAELHVAGITTNAINMRLMRLERLGLVRRTGKQGKNVLWASVEKKKSKTSSCTTDGGD